MTPALNDIVETLARITDSAPAFEASRCINQRHQHAGQCAACAAACPVSAITLTPIPQIDGAACLSCGACSAACPTDALEGLRSLAEMWHKAKEMIDARGTVALVCRAVGRGDYAAARIPCASALPPEFYIALALAGAQQVLLHTADCAACPLGASLAQAQQAVDDAQGLLAHIGRGVDVVWKTGAPPPAAAQTDGITRRGLLRGFVNAAALRPPVRHDAVDELIAQGIGSRRALLLDALSTIEISADVVVPVCEGHWGTVRANQACVGCQMCAQFCPTEALAATEDTDGTVTLWLDTARCTACGLCVRACFKRALVFEDTVRLADIATSAYQPIWQGKPPANALRSRQAFKVTKK